MAALTAHGHSQPWEYGYAFYLAVLDYYAEEKKKHDHEMEKLRRKGR